MELLIAASMTLIVVGLSGWALVTIIKSNKIAKATSEMQYDYNRAVDFIGEELKSSKQIYTDSTTFNSSTLDLISNSYFPHKDNPTWITPVFAFIPDESTSAHIIYYIVDTEASDAPGENWASRYVLYRWGPSYTSEGKYSTETDGSIQHPTNWGANALVDLVLGTWENVDLDKKKCRRNTKDDDTLNPQKWKRYPADEDAPGFFICVPTAGELEGKHAEIHALGEIRADEGKNAYLGKGHNLVYEVVTEAFLRSAISADYVFASNGFFVIPNPVPGGETPEITPVCDGDCETVPAPQPPDITLENVYGSCKTEVGNSDIGEAIPEAGSGSTFVQDIRKPITISVIDDGSDDCSGGLNTKQDRDSYRAITTGDSLQDIVSSPDEISALRDILGTQLGLLDGNDRVVLDSQEWLMLFDHNASLANNGTGTLPGFYVDTIVKGQASN